MPDISENIIFPQLCGRVVMMAKSTSVVLQLNHIPYGEANLENLGIDNLISAQEKGHIKFVNVMHE